MASFKDILNLLHLKPVCFALIVYVLFIGETFAQGGFKKRHFLQNSYDAACRDVIEAPNGNIIAAGISTDSTLGGYKLTILGMDPFGNILWKKLYGDNNLFYFNNDQHLRGPIVYDSTGFYHALAATDSSFKRTFGVLIKFNYNGDTLWQKKYKSADTLEDVIPQGLAKSVDGGFLMTGLFQHWGTNTNKCLLIKTDKEGNELWRKKLGKSVPDVQDGKSLVQDSTTKKIVIVGYQYLPTSNGPSVFGSVLITDSLGVKIFQTTYNNADAGGFLEVIQLKDKNFLVGGGMNANNDLGNLTRCKSLAVKFDINGGVIWSKLYDTLSYANYVHSFYEFPNEDILMARILDTLLNYNISDQVRIRIQRTDKNGNVIWGKYVGSNSLSRDEIVRSLNPTKDGGFLMAVWDVLKPAPNPFSIMKIDSTGCDTLEAYCRAIELGLGALYKLRELKFEVFPNPARDFLIVRIEGLRTERFGVEIKDVSGRRVNFFILKGEEDLKIDTEELKAGVYFLHVFSQGKCAETKKLLIIK